jgi:response regulator RpfG family c-di-GMP phosphodiesterase
VRDAWPVQEVVGYLIERAGYEFDPEAVRPVVRVLRRVELLDIGLDAAG